jgi:hypothetical protein
MINESDFLGGTIPTTLINAILGALRKITNLQVMRAQTTASLAGSSSTSYVDVTGTTVSWAKTGDASGSDVVFVLLASCYVSAAATQPGLGVAIGGTDYDITQMIVNPINTHMPIVGARAISGVPAGAYTPTVRFKRISGTGTTTIDTGDTVSYLICEWPK